MKAGVRWVYRDSTFSQDMEPENFALNSDDTVAYVVLQVRDAYYMSGWLGYRQSQLKELF